MGDKPWVPVGQGTLGIDQQEHRVTDCTTDLVSRVIHQRLTYLLTYLLMLFGGMYGLVPESEGLHFGGRGPVARGGETVSLGKLEVTVLVRKIRSPDTELGVSSNPNLDTLRFGW